MGQRSLLVLEGVQAEGVVKETLQLHQVSLLVARRRGGSRPSARVPETEVRGQKGGP